MRLVPTSAAIAENPWMDHGGHSNRCVHSLDSSSVKAISLNLGVFPKLGKRDLHLLFGDFDLGQEIHQSEASIHMLFLLPGSIRWTTTRGLHLGVVDIVGDTPRRVVPGECLP